MNKTKFLNTVKLMAISLMLSPSAIWSIFDAEVGLGYGGLTYEDGGTPASVGGSLKENSVKGLIINGAAHLNFSVPAVISLGVGPYIVTGSSMTYSATSAGVTYDASQFTIGGEVKAKLLALPVISPYAKLGLGSDKVIVNATSGGLKIEALKLEGLSIRAMAGLEISIAPLIFLYGEAGITSASYDGTIINISGFKAKATGYQVNFGAGINL